MLFGRAVRPYITEANSNKEIIGLVEELSACDHGASDRRGIIYSLLRLNASCNSDYKAYYNMALYLYEFAKCVPIGKRRYIELNVNRRRALKYLRKADRLERGNYEVFRLTVLCLFRLAHFSKRFTKRALYIKAVSHISGLRGAPNHAAFTEWARFYACLKLGDYAEACLAAGELTAECSGALPKEMLCDIWAANIALRKHLGMDMSAALIERFGEYADGLCAACAESPAGDAAAYAALTELAEACAIAGEYAPSLKIYALVAGSGYACFLDDIDRRVLCGIKRADPSLELHTALQGIALAAAPSYADDNFVIGRILNAERELWHGDLRYMK